MSQPVIPPDDWQNITERITAAERELAELVTRCDTMAEEICDRGPDPAATRRVQTLNADLDEWVWGTFVKLARRADPRWCTNWKRHPEAVHLLTLMWLQWEAANASEDPARMEEWTRIIFRDHTAVLLDRNGPFAACRPWERCEPYPELAGPHRPQSATGDCVTHIDDRRRLRTGALA